MVAIIHNSNSLRNALHYNENKVRQKVAQFIHSGNYPKDTEMLGFTDKINLLEHHVSLNRKTKVNSVHISLNFDPSDKLDKEILKDIADTYMHKIGFGEQPYLVYQHNDAGHPHIHIVTTNIKNNGNRISLHNLARNQSMQASQEIEKEFALTKAGMKESQQYEIKPVEVLRVHYGKSETRRAITTVLNYVLPTYKYGSLAELNAVLQQYNIIADKGSDGSRVYANNGLVYRMLDADKNKVGIPIKASIIYNKPTLKSIEANFEKNIAERVRYRQRVMHAIDQSLMNAENRSLEVLMRALQKENIRVVLRQNDQGIIYGITYVDHKNKCVFNGSHLGKQYSANAIQQRCSSQQSIAQKQFELRQSPIPESKGNLNLADSAIKLLDELMQPEKNQLANEPAEQQKFKKRRKRKQQQQIN
ncbi:MAG TPA: relaxase/mobilization nuclease domain-containing protein [Parafilimonas sp.]|nr:relaxase/mobilization nuclease domain-containing protein [Parafilimonas sp.]